MDQISFFKVGYARRMGGPLLSVAISVDQRHGRGCGHSGHASAEDTAGSGSDGSRAGDQVGGGLAVLMLLLVETLVHISTRRAHIQS